MPMQNAAEGKYSVRSPNMVPIAKNTLEVGVTAVTYHAEANARRRAVGSRANQSRTAPASSATAVRHIGSCQESLSGKVL